MTDWDPNDPRWAVYYQGWQAGYDAAEQDKRDRLTPEARDEIVLERMAALLASLRERDNAQG